MASLALSRRNFILLCLLLAGVVVAWLIYTHNHIRRDVLLETKNSLEGQLALRKSLLHNQLQDSHRHLEFLFRTPPIQGIVRAVQNDGIDPLDSTPYDTWVGRLQTIFSAYLASNLSIKQARFIGAADRGRELVRVERSGNNVESIASAKLQRKGSRDYFIFSRALKPGETYVSDISLNREFGKIEEPRWPTFRVAKAVFDENEQFFGIVILNFDVTELLASIKMGDTTDFMLFLLNHDGNYLVHPQQERAFAWEFDDDGDWLADSPYSLQALFGKFTQVPHRGLNTSLWVVADQLPLKLQSKRASLALILARKDSAIQRIILQRQVTNTALDFALGFVIFLMLFLFYRLSETSRAERQLRAEIQAVLDGTNNAILSINRRAEVQSWNLAALRVFETTANQINGIPLVKLPVLKAHQDTLKHALDNLWGGGEHTTLELRLETADKTDTFLSLSLSSILNNGGHSGAALLFHDITDAKQLQERLELLNERLEDRNTEMEKFIYSVSHDLKAPLVTISSFTEKVINTSADTLDEKNRHRLNRVLINAQNMADVLRELLDLSRVAREDLKTGACKVSACVEAACNALYQQIVESKASLSIDENDVVVTCNEKLITTCLQNLIANAIQYRDLSRQLRIAVRAVIKDNVVRISVRDNGLGIDPQYHNQIFKIFERLDMGEGNGVGLAIVKSIIEKHGGWVELESALTMGSEFTLCIPQSEPL